MSTLLLQLVGPMQSWGTQSMFTVRETGLDPSKSGVIGLLCAALGKPRREGPSDTWPSLAQLAAMRMGVRVDREGVVKLDFQTAGGARSDRSRYGVARADGSELATVVSSRYYLSDAAFLVGFEDRDRSLLSLLYDALRRPHWQIFLGRKSYLPSLPIHLPGGFIDGSLEDALASYRTESMSRRASGDVCLRTIVDGPPSDQAEIRHDVPISFSARDFGVRYVQTTWIQIDKGA